MKSFVKTGVKTKAMILVLQSVTAYTVNSADDEKRSSNKGLYSTLQSAQDNCKGVGWYGSDGTVEKIEVYMDANRNFYQVKPLGKPTDEVNKKK